VLSLADKSSTLSNPIDKFSTLSNPIMRRDQRQGH